VKSDIAINIPKHLQEKCGENLHWDLYRVDAKLKCGKIIRNLSVHSAKAFVPTSGESHCKYNFQSEDIESIRPATLAVRLKTFLFGW